VVPFKVRQKVDAVIVGAGISGAIVAESLSACGLRVVVIDRRAPVTGSTLASTALLQYEIDIPLSLLSKQVGRNRAERLWRRSRMAVDALRQRVRSLDIRCDMTARDSLYLEGDVLDADGLEVETGARRRAGFEVQLLDKQAVQNRFGIRGRAALLSYDNLCANPRKLALGFLNRACKHGALVHSPLTVESVEPGSTDVTVVTERGDLRAKSVIFATGYELPKGVPRKGHSLNSTWVLATKPQRLSSLWDGECLIWEASEPYLYLRVTTDRRVICGGEDEDFVNEELRDALMPDKVSRLEKKLAKLLPRIDPRADYTWCGTFGSATTGTPSIGRVPGMPHCYAVLGYGGNGITFSMLAAQLLTNLLQGRGDADADLYAFSRKF
jgi:glycine/D-amino acid oxidase-like deaminating enzyme